MTRTNDTWTEGDASTAAETDASTTPPPASPAPDDDTFPFVLGETLGVGGMGEVVAAQDPLLRRDVALKRLLRPGAGAEARFRAEAQVTAQLDHPNIVPVHALGRDPLGRPFLAMKRIRGRSLQGMLEDRSPPPLAARLDWFRKVCDAVAFAHARGVIHRDLKPDNVMIGAFGEVLVVDWGLARRIHADGASPDGAEVTTERDDDDAFRTREGQIAGTPAYMAPEQAAGDLSALDARTDVYGLGAVLYALITGQPPLAGDTVSVLEDVRAGRVPTPASVADVPRELDAVVRKAMALRPADRHPSATALREDVDAYLAHLPLVHVTNTRAERLAKWMERHRALVRGAAFTGMVAGTALLVAAWKYNLDVGSARDRALVAAERAADAEGRAVIELVQARIALADSLQAQGKVAAAGSALREAEERARTAPSTYDGRALAWALSTRAAFAPPPVATCAPHGSATLVALAFDADGTTLTSLDSNGRLLTWGALTCDVRAETRVEPPRRAALLPTAEGVDAVVVGAAEVVAFHAGASRRVDVDAADVLRLGVDGARATLSARDGRAAWVDPRDASVTWLDGTLPDRGVQFTSGDLRIGLSAPTGSERGGAWDARTLRERVAGLGVNDAAASGDGRLLAMAGEPGHEVVDLTTGQTILSRLGRPTQDVRLTDDGALLLSRNFDGALDATRLPDGRLLATFAGDGTSKGHPFASTRAAELVALAAADGSVQVYARTDAPRWNAGASAYALAFSPAGDLLVVGDDTGTLTVLDAASRVTLHRWEGLGGGVRHARFAPDGTRLLASLQDGTVAVLTLDGGAPRTHTLTAGAASTAWLDDAAALVIDAVGNAWRLELGAPDRLVPLGRAVDGYAWDVAALPGARASIATHSAATMEAVVLDTRTGAVLSRRPIGESRYGSAASPDGRWLATGTQLGTIEVWDVEAQRVAHTLDADDGPTMGVAFSPDGALLVTTGFDAQVDLWDTVTWTLVRRVQTLDGLGLAVRFSPDGHTVAAADARGTVHLVPLDRHRRHAAAVQALHGAAAGHAAAWAELGLWNFAERALPQMPAGAEREALAERIARALRRPTDAAP